MTALLEVAGISKRFGGVAAVRDVSFSVAAGQIVGLMGANGAGKTTLFNLISGSFSPDSGRVLLDGREIQGQAPHRICRQGIGRTYQIVRPFPNLTVRENVAVGLIFGAGRHGRADLRQREDEILEETGLHSLAGQRAAELTLAGRKRLELARALATSPRLLMLDEVMAGLTPAEAGRALEMLQSIHARRGLAILVVEHNLRAMMQLCSRVVVLHHGEKIGQGTPEAITRDPAVIAAYLGAA
jgi:branched-chain amino acid transport system ATP-binding protein